MRVKIGNEWFEPKAGCPIMVELTSGDKWNITHLAPLVMQYPSFSGDEPMDEKQRAQWTHGEREVK